MKATFTFFGLVLLCSVGFGADEGNFRVGAQAGHVGLMGDVGGRAGNAVGYGAFVGYSASSEMGIEIGLIQSSHTDLKHREVDVGMNYYWGSYDALYPHLALGVAFLNHSISDRSTASATEMDSAGFGLFAGLGAEVELNGKLALGLQGKYNKNFETTLKLSNGSTVKAIEDNVTVMLKISMIFSGKN